MLLQREEYQEGISLEEETNIWECRGQVKSLGQSTTNSLPHKDNSQATTNISLGGDLQIEESFFNNIKAKHI